MKQTRGMTALVAALACTALLLGAARAQDLVNPPPAPPPTDALPVIDGVTITETTCVEGVWDCQNTEFVDYVEEEALTTAECAPYNYHFVSPSSLKWTVAVGAIVAAVMAFGIGSNDAANSWGTSVGSNAISLRWGCFVGGIMEWAGAMAVGYGVAKTIKGIAKINDPNCFACGYCNSAMSLYAIAMMSALFAAAIFLLIASTTWMPVSTTHAIIGGAFGATWAATKWGCLNWALDGGLGGIVLSWVISPILSGVIGSIAYFSTYYTIINPKGPFKACGGNPRRNALIGVPILFGLQSYVMLFLIILKAPKTKKLYQPEFIAAIALPGLCVGIIAACLVKFLWMKKMPSVVGGKSAFRVDPPEVANSSLKNVELSSEGLKDGKTDPMPAGNEGKGTEEYHLPTPQEVLDSAREAGLDSYKQIAGDMEVGIDDSEKYDDEQIDAIWLFKYLLVYTAALESFAHGANDTGNATGAISAIIQSFQEGTTECAKPQTPVWIMAVAGFFVFVGVNTYGYRVIQTIGSSLTKINFQRGFCVEFASTFTVILATVADMPVSTTHCQVGAVVAVGLSAFGPKKVAFGLFGKIFATWVLTLPFAGGLSAAFTAAFRPAIYGPGR